MANLSHVRGSCWLPKIAALCLCTAALDGYCEAPPLGAEHAGAVVVAFDPMSMVATSPPGAAGVSAGPGMDGADHAITAAVADGVTTGVALSLGAGVEMNPLIMTSPLGLVAMTGLKIGLVKYADTLPEEDKRTAMKTSSAVWGGAAMNNLLVLLAAPGPLSVIVGLITGIATWMHMENQYQEQDRVAALRAASVAQAAGGGEAQTVEAGASADGVMAATAEGLLSAGE